MGRRTRPLRQRSFAVQSMWVALAQSGIQELTATIPRENYSSKFNRALRIPWRRLWKRSPRP